MLGPGAISTPLADLGADVIKVEPPSGDYIRQMSWPIVEGDSLLHLHISRGKRSIVLDLTTEEGRATFLDLVAAADAVVEAMRPGGLDRRGLGYAALRAVNPRIVLLTISGYGMTGPYRDLPSHGIAYDAWGGTVAPVPGPEGLPAIPDHTSIGITAGPLFGAHGAAGGRARGPGRPARAATSRWRSPTRPPRSTGCASRPPGLRAPRGRGHRQRQRRLRAPPAGHRRHGGRGPLPVLRFGRRARAVHGVGAEVLAELLHRDRPRGPVRGQAGGAAGRPRARRSGLRRELAAIFAGKTTAEGLRQP